MVSIWLTALGLLLGWIMSIRGITVDQYFPEVHHDMTAITWSHATNMHADLIAALRDPDVLMIEADVVMGFIEGGSDEELIPIMAHPPNKLSGLSFARFWEMAVNAIHIRKVRKGIKIDFKELRAVEPCMKLIKERLDNPRMTVFPLFINADILQGPVNSTRTPLDAKSFIELAVKYTPKATLSIGWTTRFGLDDISQEDESPRKRDEIRVGEYSKMNVAEMLRTIRLYAGDPPPFPHITFPVRAGIAASSLEQLMNLLAFVRTESSLTIWSPRNDPIDFKALKSLTHQIGYRKCFIDLPFDDEGSDYVKQRFGKESRDRLAVISQSNNDAVTSVTGLPESPQSEMQEDEAEGRAIPEEGPTSSTSAGARRNPHPLQAIIPFVAIAAIAAFLTFRQQ